jgi:probable phosphoglycerate mutase
VIYLARHGRTTYNHEGRFQGLGDVPLDETGLRQAQELAENAAGRGLVALWSSPLRRARQTAEAVAARTGLEIRFDPRLVETDTGDWTDRTFEEVRAEDPDGFDAWLTGKPSFAFPGGESFKQQGDRVMAAIAEIEQGPQPALVVCHGITARLALARRRGEPGPDPEPLPNGALVPLDGDGRGAIEAPPSATDTRAS